jgi:glycosyltransferase involved in cell wall biosynthesis
MEGKKMRICMVNNTKKEQPSYIVRNKIVAEKLNELGHSVYCKTEDTTPLDLDAYDVFVFNRFYEGSLLLEISALRGMGKIIVYETDDNYFGIDQTHPFHKLKDAAVLSQMELIRIADAITVSTPELKFKAIERNANAEVYVVPNALDFSTYRKRKGGNKKLRIGFQGSNIHSTDLLMVVDAIDELQKEFDFDFYILGLDDKPLSELYKFCQEYKEQQYQWVGDFKKLYEKLETMKYIHMPSVDYAEYRDMLSKANLDIGLVPLHDSEFGRGKSCLKFYEYAAVGTVSIASKVIPYTQEMDEQDLVKNRHHKWVAKLRKLIEDEQFRNERLRAQMLWVKTNRDLNKVAKSWENVFELIIKNNIK